MTSRTFFARLVIAFAILLALIVAVGGGVMYLAGQRAVQAQQIDDLERLAPLVRQWLSERPGLPAQVDDATRTRLSDAGRVLDTRITLVAGDGRVVLDTLVNAESMENHNDRPEVIAARGGDVSSIVRTSHSLGETSIYVAELVDRQHPDGLVLRLSYPQRSWSKFGVPVWQVLGGSVLAALLAVAAFWIVVQRQWIGPTHQLVLTAEQLAAGNWSTRASPAGAQELQFFSTRLNLVASHAQRQVADLKHQRADLQALVDTLPDPVLATDAAGRVILINVPAARLLALSPEKVIEQNVVSVVNDEAVLRLFEQARAASGAVASTPPSATPETWTGDRPPPAWINAADGPPALTRDLRLNRDGQWLIFQAVAKPTTGGGVLLVLRDVTALSSAMQMKTDFVANASHELRTPIAAIKIAFETLREVYGDDANQSERCMQVIDGHLRRLEEMLRDLLDLSRVENPNLKPQVRRMKTSELVAHVRSSLGPMARQKVVELKLGEGLGHDPEVPTDFLGDERLLHLVLKNLVENSIKFTPTGGSIEVSFRRAADTAGGNGPAPVVLTVEDTGIGIPQEHLDRVFERFYQVDAARSGSAGRGTGLGLAIVKHAVAALGGWIELQSAAGEGTRVTCTLPQTQSEQISDEALA